MFLLKQRSVLIWKSITMTRKAVHCKNTVQNTHYFPVFSLYVLYNSILQQSEIPDQCLLGSEI